MASKILQGDAAQAQPMAWKGVRTNPPAFSPAGTTLRDEPDERDELRRRIVELEQDAARRERQAYDRGKSEGAAAAREQAAAELHPVVDRFARCTAELAQLRPQFRREAEEDVLKLALAIARRLVHREISADPDALLGVVKAAMQKLDAREVQRVRVHPDYAALVKAHFEALGLPLRLEVAGDSGLERGAAIFETNRGTMDASLDTQLQEIHRGLIDRLSRR
jgi:flagellar assembly protein FliH